MAARPAARRVLLPLYAFNVEVARAPWVTDQPLIVEMRLQWWRDALDEIAVGGPVRRHDVTDSLAGVLDAEGARLLDALVAARRVDAERMPFATPADRETYLDATGGHLAWVAARALGARSERPVRDIAWAGSLANYLRAVPELSARGSQPLPTDADPGDLARDGLARLSRGRSGVEPAAMPALLFAWRAEPLLRRVRARPQAVAEGDVLTSEFRRRLGLIWAAARGRV
jgi:phytoene/squalene synthetase